MRFHVGRWKFLILGVAALLAAVAGLDQARAMEGTLFLSGRCQGADEKFPCLQTRVRAPSPVTWLALLSQLAPGLKPDGDQAFAADRLTPQKSLPEVQCRGDAPRFTELKAQFVGEAILALFDANDCVVLAAFSGQAPYPPFASFALSNIGGPMMGGVEHSFHALYQVGPKAWVMDVLALHGNSSETFADHLLFLVEPGKLSLTYDGPSLYSYRNGPNQTLEFEN